MGRVKSYGQFCPIARAAEIVAERWTPLLIRELLDGSHRFNDLRRGVPLMSPSLMTRRLRSLEEAGVVERRDDGYHLTTAGLDLRALVEELERWGQRWLFARLGEDHLDPFPILWNLRRRVRPEQLSATRTVISFELGDGDRGGRTWWMVIEPGCVEVSARDPGRAADVRVTTDVRTLARICLGELPCAAAEDDGRLRMEGPAKTRRLLARWFGGAAAPRSGRANGTSPDE